MARSTERNVRVGPRIPAKLLEELKADCKKQGRTLEGGIMFAVRFYLEAQKRVA